VISFADICGAILLPKNLLDHKCPKPLLIWNAQVVSFACPQSEGQLAHNELFMGSTGRLATGIVNGLEVRF
jgi:hypothetical protein